MSVDVTIQNTGSVTQTNLMTDPSFELASGTAVVRTNLCANPSSETGGANWGYYTPGATGSTSTRPTDGGYVGFAYYRATWSMAVTAQSGGVYVYGIPLSAGSSVSASMYVRPSRARTVNLNIEYHDSTGAKVSTVSGSATAAPGGVWTRVVFNGGTAPAGTATVTVTAYAQASDWAVGDTFDGDAALVEAAPVVGSYFDGNTPAAGDFTYAWSGTANASQSVQTGAGLPIAPGTHAAAIQSSAWASTGGKSLRIIPNGPNATTTDTYARVDLKALGGAVDGLTFTVLAKLHLPAPMTGPLQGGTQMRNLFVDITGGGGPTRYLGGASTPNSPNVAGDYIHRLTFTVPSVPGSPVTALGVRLYNGAAPGGGDVYWDDVVIVQGTYTGGYFDGSHASDTGWTAVWNGPANASTSTQTAATSTTLGNAYAYSVAEDSTPLDPSSSSGGFGQITLTVPDFAGSDQVMGKTITLSDGARGVTEGTIVSLSSDEFNLNITANAQLGLLNSTVSALSYSGTLGGYFGYLLGLVGITTGFQVDASITGRAVTFPGWQGNLWDQMKALCAGQQVEVTFVSDSIVMRPVRLNIAQTYRDESHQWTLDTSNIAQSVSCYYYQGVQQASALAYPLTGLAANTTVESVDANQTVIATLPLTPTGVNGTGVGASMQSVQQPVCIDNMTLGYSGTSAYTVMGNDNLPYPAAKWIANGGNVSVAIGPDNASLVVTITGCSDPSKGPYRLAIADPYLPNVYHSSLYLLGTGVFYNKQLLTVSSGVSAQQTSNQALPTIDNFSIVTSSDARSAALWAVATAQMTKTLNVNALGINGAADVNAYTQMTMGQFDALFAAGTFGAFDAQFPGETFGQFDVWSEAQVAGQFTNQAFGNVAGARVLYRNAWHRITTATITPTGLTYTAVADTTFGDLDGVWAGQTFGAFDAVWAGKTFGQFTPEPLAIS